jgi:hypothetical protein
MERFESFRDPIRTYRNKVVHNVQLGTVRIKNINLMPRIKEISKYVSMSAIQEALNKPEMLKRDFVRREVQMFSDFRTCKERLNALWEKPMADLNELLSTQRNPVLLRKYNLPRHRFPFLEVSPYASACNLTVVANRERSDPNQPVQRVEPQTP